MRSPSPAWLRRRGACLVTITYVYFLIFAQFAFLRRLAELGIADQHLQAVMAAMAVAGIALSLLAPRTARLASPSLRLRIAFAACAAAALCTVLPLTLASAIAVSLLIGSGLGLLTVTLVTYLRDWLAPTFPLLQVGIGTGLGYLICNFPPLFNASPQVQALTAAALCAGGLLLTFGAAEQAEATAAANDAAPIEPAQPAPAFRLGFPRAFLGVLASFTALIWLDSAAFFIIQNTPALKAGTWQGTAHLWTNGVLHFLAALAAAWLLGRRGLSFVLTLALAALACACLLLLHPGSVLLASVFYPVGVSLYSAALVAYPSLLSPATTAQARGRQAGWLYAVAGWVGSAMGIGMAQHLGHVPPLFIALAAAVVLLPLLLSTLQQRRRELTLTATVLLAAFFIYRASMPSPAATPKPPASERGRQVYIAEGCIHCHSQYVRPHTTDVLLWGPTQTLDELRREQPPLIGNRRQGPDLSEVGSRRSPLWMKAHFFHPAEVSHASFMPSYAYLFAGGSTRGDDLIAYLQTLRGSGVAAHRLLEQAWQPPAPPANPADGARLFAAYCSTCHAANGLTRMAWRQSFRRLPPILATGPFFYLPASDPGAERSLRIERIVKFGIPGTDMPGHEYLPDQDIAALGAWVAQLTSLAPSTRNPSPSPGEQP